MWRWVLWREKESGVIGGVMSVAMSMSSVPLISMEAMSKMTKSGGL